MLDIRPPALQVLYRRTHDRQHATAAAALRAADAYIADAHTLLLRTELAKHNLKPTIPHDGGGTGRSGESSGGGGGGKGGSRIGRGGLSMDAGGLEGRWVAGGDRGVDALPAGLADAMRGSGSRTRRSAMPWGK